jgi:subtilisin family serine protease
VRPAWSEQFEPGTLEQVAALAADGPITADWAWGDADGAGVRVAVLDSGIEAAHPAVGGIAGGVAIEPDDAAPDGVRLVGGPHEDLSGHGTACAGLIRALAPRAELHSVRVIGRSLTGKGHVLAAGLRWALEHDMDVVNLSLSSRKRENLVAFHELVDAAYFAHRMVVCAINNVAVTSYPAEFASVISVAAHDGRDPFGIDYNPAPPVEVGAPGIDIDVAWRGGTTIRSSGNSFAAAHVSGLVARILSKHPGLTPFQMKTVLQAVARNAVR